MKVSASRRRPSEPRSGASQSKARLGDRLRAWLAHHRSVGVESLARMLRSPLQSLLTWLVVAIALALPTALFLALSQFQDLGQGWESQPRLSLFLQQGADEAAARELRNDLENRPEWAAVEYVSPGEALREFEESAGLGEVLENLGENPLPPVLLLLPAGDGGTPERMASLREELTARPLVDEARLDMDWVRRLHQIMVIAERLVLSLAGLLALGVLLVVGNTIRLSIENRRDEIVIVKLVGGTKAFVRRPFLYTGFWYGFGGGLLAWLLVTLGVQWLAPPVAQLADLYQSDLRLRGLGWGESLVLVFGAGALGLFGAAFAVSKHLHAIEPR